MSAPLDPIPTARATIAEHTERGLALLAELVSQNSFTLNLPGVNRVQARLAEELRSLGLVVREIPCSDRGSVLVAETHPGMAHPLLLVAHADTVHPESPEYASLWSEGNRLLGPGVYDLKGSLVQILLTLTALREQGRLGEVPLKILINSAEENGSPATVAAIRDEARGARAALVLESGRVGGAIVLERSGCAEVRLTVEGVPAHAGNQFFEGRSAITGLARALVDAAKLSDQARGVTVNPGRIEGGGPLNVVADRAVCDFDIRAASLSDLEGAIRALGHLDAGGCATRLEVFDQCPPLAATTESRRLAEEYRGAAAAVGSSLEILPRVGGLSDANIISGVGVPVIDALGPVGGKAHTREEFVEAGSIPRRALELFAFIARRS